MRSSPPVHTTHPAFALYGLVWIVGSILGNAIGGYLSHPVERYPGIFARGGSLEEHPYLPRHNWDHVGRAAIHSLVHGRSESEAVQGAQLNPGSTSMS
jgi:hypothetical protein